MVTCIRQCSRLCSTYPRQMPADISEEDVSIWQQTQVQLPCNLHPKSREGCTRVHPVIKEINMCMEGMELRRGELVKPRSKRLQLCVML